MDDDCSKSKTYQIFEIHTVVPSDPDRVQESIATPEIEVVHAPRLKYLIGAASESDSITQFMVSTSNESVVWHPVWSHADQFGLLEDALVARNHAIELCKDGPTLADIHVVPAIVGVDNEVLAVPKLDRGLVRLYGTLEAIEVEHVEAR